MIYGLSLKNHALLHRGYIYISQTITKTEIRNIFFLDEIMSGEGNLTDIVLYWYCIGSLTSLSKVYIRCPCCMASSLPESNINLLYFQLVRTCVTRPVFQSRQRARLGFVIVYTLSFQISSEFLNMLFCRFVFCFVLLVGLVGGGLCCCVSVI